MKLTLFDILLALTVFSFVNADDLASLIPCTPVGVECAVCPPGLAGGTVCDYGTCNASGVCVGTRCVKNQYCPVGTRLLCVGRSAYRLLVVNTLMKSGVGARIL